MITKLDKLPKSRVKLFITVPEKDIGKFFDKAYEKLAPQVKISGFRPGKAPKMMILEAVGQNRYNSEALNLALMQSYFSAVQKEGIIPITQPAVSIKQFGEHQDFVFEAEVDILSKIILGDYQSVRVKNKNKDKSYQATDKELEIIVKRLKYQGATFNNVDRPAKNGDRIEIEFEGYDKKIKQENLCSKNYPLILGEGVLIPGFEDKIIGMKKGEEKKFDLDVPATVKGAKAKKIDFTVKMLDVKEVKLPELNDDFAKKFGHNNPENLFKAIKENIIREKEIQDKMQLEQEVLEKVAEKVFMEIPQSLVEQDINRRITQIQQRSGPGFQEFLKKSGKSLEDLRKDLTPQAEKSVKTGLILGELAKEFGLAKIKPKTAEEQKQVVRKTIDKLVAIATKR